MVEQTRGVCARMLRAAAKYAGSDEERPALTTVVVSPDGGLAASDSHIAVLIRPEGAGEWSQDGLWLVPTALLRGLNGDGKMQVEQTDQTISLTRMVGMVETRVSSPVVGHTFPNLARTLARACEGPARVRQYFDPALLARALTALAQMGVKRARCEMRGDDVALVLEGEADGHKVAALVMPMRVSPEEERR